MNQRDWFKHWFNSHHYLILYKNRNEEEAKQFFDLIKSNIPITKDWKVLDFCCGSGRLSRVIAKAGFEVTGIDLSQFLIGEARKVAVRENLQCNFKICDAREFDEKEKYQLAISFFTSLGYFDEEENRSTFNILCRSVVSNGWVVLDYFNSEFVAKNLVKQEEFNFENLYIKIQRRIDENRIKKLITIESELESDQYIESVQIYSFYDFEKMFHENGFVVRNVKGDYNGADFNQNSPRVIIFAQRV